MNNNSPLRKAIASRGAARRLPADFTLNVMSEIREGERVRRRCALVWSIVGYVIAAVVAAVTLVYYCGDMFAKVAMETADGFSESSAPWLGVMTTLLPCVVLLLLLEKFLRRRLLLADKGKPVSHGDDDRL